MTTYLERLHAAQQRNHSWLCIGLDPQPDRLPGPAQKWDEPLLPFNKAIIDATADLVCAYKPNLGFYLQWGAAGVIALERTILYIPDEIPVILDCKAGDIGNTQAAWAAGLFDTWGVDAVTVNPYVGMDAVIPMIGDRPDKGIYLLARTSNPGAGEFQGDARQGGGLTVEVVRKSARWLVAGSLGYVVGATYPEELALIREMVPAANFLIPGIGAQGGSLEAAVRYGPDQLAGPVINVGREIIYASQGEGFAAAARQTADELRKRINDLREAAG